MKKLIPCSETLKLGAISVLLVITSNTTEAVEARIDIHSFLYKNCDAGDWFEFESEVIGKLRYNQNLFIFSYLLVNFRTIECLLILFYVSLIHSTIFCIEMIQNR